jgi:hypothetical protein
MRMAQLHDKMKLLAGTIQREPRTMKQMCGFFKYLTLMQARPCCGLRMLIVSGSSRASSADAYYCSLIRTNYIPLTTTLTWK